METNKKNKFYQQPLLGKYLIKLKLKTGGFGKVYLARDINDKSKQYAIKIISKKHERYARTQTSLYQLFKQIGYTHGFVKEYDIGQKQDNIFVVMQLVGQDLQQIMLRARQKNLSVKTCLMVGLQVVDRIQALHKIGYIHRDIKPDNLLIGLKEKNKVIYLIDFGLAKKIKEKRHNDEKGKAVGTLAYMSVRANAGQSQEKADDIESLMYTILYLMEGNLPWMKIPIRDPTDVHKVKIMKQSIKKIHFKHCNAPKQVFEIIQDMRKLKKNQNPDYLKIKYKLLESLKSIKEQNDFIFDWVTQYEKPKKKTISPPKKIEEKQQIMKQQNQQFVQKEIYEVFKFLNNEENKNKEKTAPKTIVKKQQPNQKNNVIDRRAHQKPKQEKLIRPLSSQPIGHKNNKQSKNKWLEQVETLQKMRFEGPSQSIISYFIFLNQFCLQIIILGQINTFYLKQTQ